MKMKKNIIKTIILILIIISVIFIYKIYIIDKKKIKNEPDKNEPYKKKTKVKDNYGDGEEKELKYDYYVVASGFAGAADNVYYTRNNTLYHLRLSTNKSTRLAEGITKLEEDRDTVRAYKNSHFKIINEDTYVTYVD